MLVTFSLPGFFPPSSPFAQLFLAARHACSLLHLPVTVPFTFAPVTSSVPSPTCHGSRSLSHWNFLEGHF